MNLYPRVSLPLLSVMIAFAFIMMPDHSVAQADSASVRKHAINKDVFFMKHQVALEHYSFSDPVINLKLHESMRRHRKSTTNLIIGTALAGLGLAAIISGIASVEEPVDPGTITWDFGPSISDEAFGGILLAGSLPFFMMAESNRKKMKRSLAETRQLLVQ